MTPGNFDWFLHVMLFYHTKYVIIKQERKKQEQNDDIKREEYLGLGDESRFDEPSSDDSDSDDSVTDDSSL